MTGFMFFALSGVAFVALASVALVVGISAMAHEAQKKYDSQVETY